MSEEQTNEQQTTEQTTEQTNDAGNPWPEGNFRIPGKGGNEVEIDGKQLWDLASQQKAGQDSFEKAKNLNEETQAMVAENAKFAQIGKAMSGMRTGTIEEQINLGRDALTGMGYSEEEANEYLEAWHAQYQTDQAEQTQGTEQTDDEGDTQMNKVFGDIANVLSQVTDRLDKIESRSANYEKDLHTRTREQIKNDFLATAEKDEEFGRFAKDSGALGKRAKEYAWNRLLELAEGAETYDESRLFEDALSDARAFFKDTAGAHRRNGESSMPALGGLGNAPGLDLFKQNKPIEREPMTSASYADNGALRLLQRQAANEE